MTKKLKKPIAFLTVFAMLLSVLLYFPEGTFGGFGLSVRAGAETILKPSSNVAMTKPSGTGKYDNPYIIKTKAELYWFADMTTRNTYTNIYAELGADIEVNANVLDSNGNLNSGTFDEWPGMMVYNYSSFKGNNHTISGIVVNKPDQDYQGFFTQLQGTVNNLNIVDSYIVGQNYVGGICGQYTYQESGKPDSVTIENCTFQGTVIGQESVGGIAGLLNSYPFTIQNCTSSGKIIGKNKVGGIFGDNKSRGFVKFLNCTNNSTVSGIEKVGGIIGLLDTKLYNQPWKMVNCKNTGNITGTSYVGGICGKHTWGNEKIDFTDCFNTGNIVIVENNDVSSQYAGGICGYFDSYCNITNCYNTGSISGKASYVGGISGNLKSSRMNMCWNSGSIEGTDYVGGLIGDSSSNYDDHKIRNCYNLGDVKGDTNVGGICAGLYYIHYCFNTGKVTGNSDVYGVTKGQEDHTSYCYYDNEITPDLIDPYGVTGMSTAEFESGKVAYKLRGGENCWGQNLNGDPPADEHPILTNGEPELVVYFGKDDGDNDVYHNHLTTENCAYCPYVPEQPAAESGKYVIDNARKLYWFSMYVNGDPTVSESTPEQALFLRMILN